MYSFTIQTRMYIENSGQPQMTGVVKLKKIAKAMWQQFFCVIYDTAFKKKYCQAQPSTPASAGLRWSLILIFTPTHPGNYQNGHNKLIVEKQSWLAWLVDLISTSDRCDKSSNHQSDKFHYRDKITSEQKIFITVIHLYYIDRFSMQ